MLANVGCLFDPLFILAQLLDLLLFVCALSQLSKSGDHEVPYLLVVRVAGDKEHISCDSFFQHLVSGDTVVAQSQKDPRHIGLYDHVYFSRIITSKGI